MKAAVAPSDSSRIELRKMNSSSIGRDTNDGPRPSVTEDTLSTKRRR
jgi:hypothetical protein